ncbi:carbonic anhydrase [Dimargaris cristalligena]|uniref:Carbonic anhydrase n=1 Tax=Dimargaris cristalligena TaxID=215637 RepID=A0A4P9ZRK0_9FUNG|nr:carbonic anhydrase [Dimargaris cristalligena]|eukprot:RKP36166.1 carbonic anhydrase [Dimargaris cristalligena]
MVAGLLFSSTSYGTEPSATPKTTYDIQSAFKANAEWSMSMMSTQSVLVNYLKTTQTPKILWIGCSDSRVVPEELLKLNIGDVFTYRNIANIVNSEDWSQMAFLEYALMHLNIDHIVVAGHVSCGGVKAALSGTPDDVYLDGYLSPIKTIYTNNEKYFSSLKDDDERNKKLTELNVVRSVRKIAESQVYRKAIKVNSHIKIHSWIYNITDLHVNAIDYNAAEYRLLHL